MNQILTEKYRPKTVSDLVYINDEYENNDTTDEPEDYEMDGSENDYENIDISEYVQEGDDEVADYKLRDTNYADQGEAIVIPHKTEVSFMELMHQQLGMLTMSDHQRKVAEQLIGSLDEDGYLRREINAIIDDLAFRQNIITSAEEVAGLLVQLQQFDPPGVGARSLQECLLLQLERKLSGTHEKPVSLAIKVLEKYFDEFEDLFDVKKD